MLSLHTGYDTAYLTDAVGRRAATDYYTAAKGEPPGYWQGAGARALGLAGQVDAEVMRRLYHEDIGPDGQVLGRRQRQGELSGRRPELAVRADRVRGSRAGGPAWPVLHPGGGAGDPAEAPQRFPHGGPVLRLHVSRT